MLGLDIDQDIDAFMKAEAQEGRPTSLVTEFIIKMLGLEICGDTQVGDEMRPACSPGQKKRVTVGKLLIFYIAPNYNSHPMHVQMVGLHC